MLEAWIDQHINRGFDVADSPDLDRLHVNGPSLPTNSIEPAERVARLEKVVIVASQSDLRVGNRILICPGIYAKHLLINTSTTFELPQYVVIIVLTKGLREAKTQISVSLSPEFGVRTINSKDREVIEATYSCKAHIRFVIPSSN